NRHDYGGLARSLSGQGLPAGAAFLPRRARAQGRRERSRRVRGIRNAWRTPRVLSRRFDGGCDRRAGRDAQGRRLRTVSARRERRCRRGAREAGGNRAPDIAARSSRLAATRRAPARSGGTSGRAVVAAAATAAARVTSTRQPMAADYKLYCFAQSGNAYKAALMLAVTGSNWAPRFVDYFGGETRTPAYRAINVMGEVPVLEHEGRQLTQSGVILDYLAERTGHFGPANGDERRDILRWLFYDNHKLTSYTATYRFLRTF